MKSKTVYQADQYGFFQYPTVANELPLSPGSFNVPYGAYEDAPPLFGSGMAAKRAGDRWAVVEDRRGQVFYLVSSGDEYRFGEVVEVDGESVTYDGGGAVPAWLTLEAPAPVQIHEGET
ncbi:hypothetical protein PPN31119_04467 [Pandoraea pnomenusa]|uniref:Phage tail protein n=1 Tax=Pandoraea pnomenusa TaxID=93220 RepID=A0ABY6WUQ7_9BURK|nr:phage tail protein [Pandoraea pnomenusa]VVE72988.1 hypothetical protein PPN31119_04467 [Pandoraea pnomenusa]